ncbi:uncharacterized protein F54H12.2 [Trichonephila clavipes]|nr:uncharacterized protein F54H12.2 [Trichonephila clavipes]
MHQDLAAFYENPEVPNSFGGVEALHRSVKGKYSKKDVKHWLSQKDAYTLHKPVRHKFQRNRVFVSDIDRQFQADLVDMQSLAEFNKGYKYLTCIDLFSKFAWAVPLKDKFGKSVKSGLEIFKERKPKVLQTDSAGDGNISSTVKRTIDVGCYETMLDIISAVQLALPKNPNRFTKIYNKATKRVKINAVRGSSLHLENLGEFFLRLLRSNFTPNCGDTQAPLLRIVRTKGKDGETISQYYDRPQYLPLVRHSFQTIQSELRLNSGDFVPFERGQIGSGLTHYKGINSQKGYGIGGIFRRLFRAALPFLVKGGKTIGKEVLMTGSRVASDVLSGENFKEAVKTRSKESGKKLAQKAIDRVQSMVGKGQYKRKRQMPKKLFVGCVDNEAFHGAFSKSPYEFKHFNLNFIGVYVDGQPVPHNPLELDFSKDQYIRAYQTLFVGTDRMGQDRGEHLSLIKHSNLRLELKFGKSLEQTVCVIVFAEFENLIEINKSRNILYDFGN